MKRATRLSWFLALVFLNLDAQAHEVENKINHNHHNSSLHNILTHRSISELNVTGLQSILNDIGFVNCSESSVSDCNECLEAAQLMKANGIQMTDEINETLFNEVAPSILLYLLPSDDKKPNCSELNSTIFSSEEVYAAIAKKYDKSKINGEVLDELLEAINKTKLSRKLTRKPCFSAESVLLTLEEEEEGHGHEGEQGNEEEKHKEEADMEKPITHEQYRLASALVLEHLLSNYCIEESHSHDDHDEELPEKTFFINKILEKYGSNGIIEEEKFEKLFEELGIVKKTKDDDHDHDHDHRRRRRDLSPWPSSTSRRRISRNAHGDSSTKKFERCYSADEVMKIFNVNVSEGVKVDKFQELCPSLIYQLESKTCAEKKGEQPTAHGDDDDAKIWGYGIISVTVISLLSLIGAASIPFFGKAIYDNLMTYFVALAAGTLCGDGLMHLFPHSLGIHMHEGEHSEESHEEELEIIWKSIAVVAAVYAFYIVEFVMTFLINFRGAHVHEHSHGTGLSVISNPSNDQELTDDVEAKKNGALASSPPGDKQKPANILTAFGLMVIIGDVMHNIVDGIAIGVAFSEMHDHGVSGGISTSIAIFCHELPHELGDFAVLVSSGLSFKRALLFNFFSACCCYIGLFIGIGIGELAQARLWAFAVTAGMFIYVSLVTVLPEMMRNKDIRRAPLRVFFLQNLGLLTGFIIMALLAIYEEDIVL